MTILDDEQMGNKMGADHQVEMIQRFTVGRFTLQAFLDFLYPAGFHDPLT